MKIGMKYLKIKTLTKEWHDKDEVLLHSAFQLLSDFIEKEKPGKLIDWSTDQRHKKAWKEIRALYGWWKAKRPSRKDPLENKSLISPPLRFKKIPGSNLSQMVQPDRRKYAKYYQSLNRSFALQQKWDKEDQRNLHRLVEIRSFLWT